jgi:hypothetical protein
MPLLAAFPLQRHTQNLSHPVLEADAFCSGSSLLCYEQAATVGHVLEVGSGESRASDRAFSLFEKAISNSLNDGASSHTHGGKTARSL